MNTMLIKAIASLAVIVGLWFGWRAVKNHYIDVGRAEVQAKWEKDKIARKQAEELAEADRKAANAREKERQDRVTQTITEKYHADLAKVRGDLAAAKRVRVGTAICGQGSSGATQAPGAQGSEPADTGTRVVREDIERDIRTMMVVVEEAFATGRACQSFIRDNGFAPEQPASPEIIIGTR